MQSQCIPQIRVPLARLHSPVATKINNWRGFWYGLQGSERDLNSRVMCV